ncbi:hypothetical protein EDC04DRAFT_2676778 [Pisolithus marmoratus]|nr:hypothetical protein EDC04DRAFT_2676778 [Pisolithus marmoratus]
MTPECFNVLLATLQSDPIFQNQSSHAQMPVEMQLAIALYRFGDFYWCIYNRKDIRSSQNDDMGTFDLVISHTQGLSLIKILLVSGHPLRASLCRPGLRLGFA